LELLVLNHTDAIWRFTDTRRRDMLSTTASKPSRQPDLLLAAIIDTRHVVPKPIRQQAAGVPRPNLARRVLTRAWRASPA
jgi:hypothetical protein